MFLFRTAVVAVVAIMLMPTDDPHRAGSASHQAVAAGRTPSFCERNPSTCAAGVEIWATFVKKAEAAFVVGVKLLAEQISRSGERPAAAVNASMPAASPAPVLDNTHMPAQQKSTPRGAMTAADMAPAWRGANARATAH